MYPELFEIGPIVIRSYGVIIATAFLVTFLLLYREARKKNFYPDKILDLELLVLLSGIIGARILHVFADFSYYRERPFDIILIWRGGLAFYGGLILAIAASCVFILKNRMPLGETNDFFAPYIALGHSIGRIGCFLNGCCFGKPVERSFLGVIFPGEAVERHPTQIYGSIALFSIFVILKLVQRKPPFSGFVFGLYFSLYSFQRFFIDFLRDDMPRYALNLTISQVTSVIIFIAGITFLICVHKNGRTEIQSR